MVCIIVLIVLNHHVTELTLKDILKVIIWIWNTHVNIVIEFSKLEGDFSDM